MPEAPFALIGQPEDILRRLFVKIPGRFIGKNQFGAVHQRPRNGDSLQFAAGKLAWKMISSTTQANSLQHFVGPFYGAFSRNTV